MSEENSYITVGKVRDAHGLKGEWFIVVFAKEASWLDRLESFFLVRKEKLDGEETLQDVRHNFTVSRLKRHKAGFIVKSKEIENRTQAEAFQGALFQIPVSLVTSKPGEVIFLREIQGFKVIAHEKEVGTISGFSSNGAQDLLVVNTNKGHVEVPLVEQFIKNLDFKTLSIYMELPEGLVDSDED